MLKNFVLCLGLAALVVAGLDAQARSRGRSVSAFQPDFLPLEVGNSWTLESQGRFGGDQRTIRVAERVEINSIVYYRVEGLQSEPALLRRTARGQIVELTGTGEALWYDFAAPINGSWRAERNLPCLGQAMLAARGESVRTPAREFNGALVVRYGPTNCADAGLGDEIFAPGVGLVQQTEITIAGPRSYSLLSARVGGQVIRGPGVSFGVKVDRAAYTPNLFPPVDPATSIPTLTAELTIENSTSEPLILRFASGQQYDLSITNEAGETVFFWSANKLFTQATTSIELTDDARTFVVKTPLSAGDQPLPPGVYLVEAWLTTAGSRVYSASVPIQVTEPVF